MRTLTTTLAAAVSATGRRPAAQVTLADDQEHYALFRQNAPAKAVDGCAACTAPDGSLIRAALFDNGGSGNADLAVQRITDPTQASQWSTWTTLVAAGCEASQPVALSSNPGGIVRLFYGDGLSAGATIKLFESSNSGASWTGPSTLYAGASSFLYLASAGNDDLLACRAISLGVWDVQFFKRTGGVWSAPVSWSLGTLSSMYGIAAAWNGANYFFALSGWFSAGIGLEAFEFDGAATWTNLNFIAPVDGSNLGFQYRLPGLLLADGLFRLTFVEHDDGSIDGTVYDRFRLTRSLDFSHWSSPIPASPETLTSATGASFVKAFGSYYATTPSVTFSWPLYTSTDPARNSDVSAQVLRFQRHEALLRPGQCQVTLSNQDGLLTSAPGLVRNGTLRLNEGYVTGAGTELVNVATAAILHWTFHRAAGEHELVIVAEDRGSGLDLECPALLAYQNRTVLWLAIEIAARAAIFQVFWPATPAMSQTVAAFSIPPGQTWRSALHRLIDAFGIEYVIRADGSLALHDPSEGPASSWTWQNEVLAAQLAQAADAAGHVRVFGQHAQAEAWDYTQTEAQ
ncbi:MAG: hypothetical protein JOZ39_11075, partial [Chloroflexi bacterium]|nr:hypothetical protein [Chloroflexota bacterium]